jgi:hypothetical protein
VNPADLSAALGAIPRLPGAACRGNHDLFDLRDLDDPDRADVGADAMAICERCPALAACEQWLASTPPHLRPYGVVAGLVRRPRPPRARKQAVA